MKVRLVKKVTIEEYAIANARSRTSLRNWGMDMKFADWKTPDDIIKDFPSADLLGNGTRRVIFNIGGNNYRMICKYWFGVARVHLYIKWIGTHAEYDNLCDFGKQYTINDY